jgi:hypothetical protein
MDPNLFLAFLVLRGELTETQRQRIQIKLGAMAQPLDQAVLQTQVLDVGALLRLREEFRHWRAGLDPEQIERVLQRDASVEIPSATAGRDLPRSLSATLVVACLEDAVAKRMDSILLRFDEMSRPALEILYRYGPHVRDAMAFQEQLAHQIVAEMHDLAGTKPLPEARTTLFQCEIHGAKRTLSLHQSARREGKETLELRLNL